MRSNNTAVCRCPVPCRVPAAAAACAPVPVTAAGGAAAGGSACCGACVTHHLVAYPAKDNYEGRVYPLDWIQQVRGSALCAVCSAAELLVVHHAAPVLLLASLPRSSSCPKHNCLHMCGPCCTACSPIQGVPCMRPDLRCFCACLPAILLTCQRVQVHTKSDGANKFFVVLDAAAHAASHVLDLAQVKPDFVTLSFYKVPCGHCLQVAPCLWSHTAAGLCWLRDSVPHGCSQADCGLTTLADTHVYGILPRHLRLAADLWLPQRPGCPVGAQGGSAPPAQGVYLAACRVCNGHRMCSWATDLMSLEPGATNCL